MRLNRWLFLLGPVTAVALVISACGGAATVTPTTSVPSPTATKALPTVAPTPTSSTAPTAQATATTRPAPQPTPTAVVQATPTSKAPSGTLNVALNTIGTETWLQRLQAGGSDQSGTYMLAESLIWNNSKTRVLEPRLAVSWSVDVRSATDVVWTFKLRPGTQFNEGKGEMTAEDVKFTFADLLRSDTRAVTSGAVKGLMNSDIKNFEVVGPYEFRLHASKLDVTSAYAMSGVAWGPVILPKAYYDSVGDDGFNKHPIGTGPFIFKSHQSGSKATLEAVPNHWRKTSDAQTVNLLIVPEVATRLAMVRAGQADLSLMTTASKRELTAANLKTISVPRQSNVFTALGGMYYDMPEKNCTTCPWVGYTDNARKVREALTIAIDRKTMVDKLLFGEGEPAAAPFIWMPGPFPFNDPSWQVPPYDPARAKQLLTEAGYPSGFTIKMAIMTLAGLPEMADVAQSIAAFWKDIGVKVDQQTMDFTPTFRAMLGSRDTSGYAWVLYITFADEGLRNMASGFTKGGPLAYLQDPKVDEYIPKASQEANDAKRFELTKNLGTYFVQQRLGIPLFSANTIWGAGPRFQSWDNIVGHAFLNNVEGMILVR